MKKLYVLVIFMALFLFPQFAAGQSAKETYRALKKLEAKIQSGISYREYGPALGDTKFEVNMFSESPEAREKPKLKEIFNKTMRHYEEAGNVWGCKFAGSGAPFCMLPAEQGGTDSDLINQILRSYPKARYKVDSIGRLPYSEALTVIWQEASDELKKAGPLIN